MFIAILLQKSQGPCHDYFYSLKNVSFCAFHPRDHRYLGFITKHPTLQRFACHVFIGQESTRPVAEAVGWALEILSHSNWIFQSWQYFAARNMLESTCEIPYKFCTTKNCILRQFVALVNHEINNLELFSSRRAFHRFYTKFIETAFPIEDIYIE